MDELFQWFEQHSALSKGLFTVIGALLGALITTVGHRLNARRMRDKKALAILRSHLAKVLDVGDVVRSKIQIHYENKPVQNLFIGQFAIQNSCEMDPEIRTKC